MLKTCVVGVRSGTHPRCFFSCELPAIVFHCSTSRSESTWQSILKSVFATIISTSQFVKSQGIEHVAERLQGLIDGVIENSKTNHMQLDDDAASSQKSHPENRDESARHRGSASK